MFTQQDSEVIQKENEDFYTHQNIHIERNQLTARRNEYLNSDFFQTLTVKYYNYIHNEEEITKEEKWLFGKSLDILIRKNITHKSFINYNDETKQDFYSNAMYRCLNYSIKSFKPDKSAFNYFTSTIRNAFKEELNKQNAQRKIAKEQYEQKGIHSIMYNIDTKASETLNQAYIEHSINTTKEQSIPYFISKVLEKYSNYTCKPISLVEDDNAPRFKRKYFHYPLLIQEGDSGVIIEYVNLQEVNENNGQYKTELQKKIITARQNGYQVFYLFSDIWMDKEIDDEIIFKKIDTLLSNIKAGTNYNLGYNLMIDYIPYNLIESLGITAPNWWLLDEKLDDRHLVNSQDVEEYLHYKNISSKYTRVWDAGNLKKEY